MSRHSTAFEAEREVSAETAEQLRAEPNPPSNPTVSPVPVPVPAARPTGRLRRLLLAGVAVAALAGASWYGFDYWTVGRFLVSTDDAYVRADNTTIAPKVSGYLREVLVGDNEPVKAGQVLARIDERDFKVALDQARADVAAAQATVTSKRAQLEVQQSIITAAKATIEVDIANKTFAGQENKRYTDLAATGYGSQQNAQAAQSKNAGAEAAILRDQANLVSALKQVVLLKAEIVQAEAAAARASALQAQAELNLGYTTITAPIDGIVGNRTLRVGQFAGAGLRRLCDRELQGDAAHPCARRPAGRRLRRHVPRPGRARSRRLACAGQRSGVRAAAARQRHRQFHQDRAAHPREDRAGGRRADRIAAGHVGRSAHLDQAARRPIQEDRIDCEVMP
jgi:membrane fusion protein, multidrug efflux system